MTRQPNRPRPFLTLRNASFRLGDRLVFRHSNWVIDHHEQWAVLGENGSGKSLLADALRGRLPRVGGEMTWGFRAPAGLMHEEAIGHVSFEDRRADLQNTVVQSRWNSLEEEEALRVRDFLSYERVMDINPFEVSDHRPARLGFDRRLRRAAALLDVARFFDHSLISLSNGERQRVQLAQALCHPLRLLILDEPFIGLDAATRRHLHRVLGDLMRTPLRVLVVTNRVEDIPGPVSHLAWIAHRHIAMHGTREEVLSAFSTGPRFRRSSPPTRPKPASVKTDRGSNVAASAPKELFSLRDVTVRYGANTILDHVNWTVREGESWALLGPNGSGKTALLSLILGDNPQACGNQVIVFDKQRGAGDSIWDIKRRIGWVSPDLQLHFDPEATCLEVVLSGFDETAGLFSSPTRRQRKAAGQWLARLHLKAAAPEPLFSLSAGLQRMVFLARALVKKPQLLVLDEPCQGLDTAHRRYFVQTVDRLIREQSLAIIYVSHRPDEIPTAITRVFRLAHGRGREGSMRSPNQGWAATRSRTDKVC